MELSTRIQKVKPSATLALNAKAAELRSQGKDVLSLAVGEPDFSPPPNVFEAVRNALDQNFIRYTPVAGIPELLDKIAAYFNHFYQIQASRENVIVTNGGKQGLYNLFQVLLNQGDEVLIPGPYWLSYPDMVLLADGKPVIVPADAEADFLVRPADLEQYLTPKSKVLILNSPSNPTGSHYSQEMMDEIANWALSKGLFIISDEIYDQLVYPPARPASLCKKFEANPEKVAVINGLSKSFALTGWRIGYVLTDAQLIKNLSKIQGQSTSNICSIAQKAAVAALEGSWDFLQEQRQNLARRRDFAWEKISSWPGVVCPKPDGAFYLFPRMDGLYNHQIKDSSALCEYILEKAEVALVPGQAFGDDRCIRFSYAVADSNLEKALNKVEAAVKAL